MAKRILSRGKNGTLNIRGEDVPVRYLAPVYDDAPELSRRYLEFLRRAAADMVAVESVKEGEVAGELKNAYDAIDPAFVRRMFERYIKPLDDLVDDTGAAVSLYDVATLPAVTRALGELHGLATLTEKEGKASGSHSTSTPDPVASSDSVVTPTVAADGPST